MTTVGVNGFNNVRLTADSVAFVRAVFAVFDSIAELTLLYALRTAGTFLVSRRTLLVILVCTTPCIITYVT